MDFTSLNFLFYFLPLFFLFYLLIAPAYRKGYWIAASAVFYALLAGESFFFLLGLILVNYAAIVALRRAADRPALRQGLTWGVALANMGVLLFYKIITTPWWAATAQTAGVARLPGLQNPVFPVGLSFVTFQVAACLIDAYRVREKTPTNLVDYAAYLLFFPKIITGPITRYTPFEAQMRRAEFSWERFATGARRVIRGLAKKAFIADPLALLVTAAFSLERPYYPTWIAWVALLAFYLQIYYDFSGYIDMALGVAHMIGFDLPENFNAPYRARSLGEFWRRWHMTLTAWFRDYVFFPLEYKRRRQKFLRVETDTLLVFLLTGLWHGVTPNFVVWGLLQGVVIAFENSRAGGWLKRLPGALQHLYLTGVVLAGWVVFRAPSLEFAGRFLQRLVVVNERMAAQPFSATQPIPIINNSTLLVIGVGLVGLLPLERLLELPWARRARQTALGASAAGAGYLLLLLAAIAMLASQSFVPSIYGKF